jgi:hypothetical protein
MHRRSPTNRFLDTASAVLVAFCLLVAGGMGGGPLAAAAALSGPGADSVAPCGGHCAPDEGGCCCDPMAARCLCAMDGEDDPRHGETPASPAPQRFELRLLLCAAWLVVQEPERVAAPAQRPVWSSRLPVALGESRAIRLRSSLILT